MRLGITISRRRVTWVLAAAASSLVLAGLAGQIAKHWLGRDRLLGFVRLFDLIGEANVPAWYSSVTLLLCAVLLASIATAKRRAGARFARHWTGLAAIFLVLSIDEAATIHETIGILLREARPTRGVFFFAWVIPGLAFVVAVGLAYFNFLVSLPSPTRRLFVIAAALYVGGALGGEMVEGYFYDYHGPATLLRIGTYHVEEALEMAGVLVFIRALISCLVAEIDSLEVRFER